MLSYGSERYVPSWNVRYYDKRSETFTAERVIFKVCPRKEAIIFEKPFHKGGFIFLIRAKEDEIIFSYGSKDVTWAIPL
jgi:hypothetical protein